MQKGSSSGVSNPDTVRRAGLASRGPVFVIEKLRDGLCPSCIKRDHVRVELKPGESSSVHCPRCGATYPVGWLP